MFFLEIYLIFFNKQLGCLNKKHFQEFWVFITVKWYLSFTFECNADIYFTPFGIFLLVQQ